MESEAASALAEADNLREAARLEDLHLWKMENEFYSREGRKKCEYWMAAGDDVETYYNSDNREYSIDDCDENSVSVYGRFRGFSERWD
jgi:hypothetical protein